MKPMGYLRFNRRMRIFPGLRLNFGKRGVSASVGVRGAHVTLGRRGVRTTVGVPGTGLSYTSLAAAHHGRTARARRGTPAGWYADPWKTAKLRYWDGSKWTGYNSG
jgi:hypothetical protein